MTKRIWVTIAALLVLTGPVGRATPPLPQPEQPFNRRVLALYSSAETGAVEESLIHRCVETVLNHLGLMVEYHDVDTGLPDEKKMARYRGFVTWFQDDKMKGSAEYCAWFARQVAAGRKAVVLGTLGAFEDQQGKATPPKLVDRAFAALGLKFDRKWTDNPLVIKIKSSDKAMVEFERTLKNELTFYQRIVSTDPRNKVYLTLHRTDLKDSDSQAVVVTPTGGFVLSHYALHQAEDTFKRQWRINPFRFFEAALGVGGTPRMDVTTLNGARLFYSHIDGDGFRNVSEVDTKKLSPEIIRDEILKKYDLPFTVSVITGEVDPGALGSDRTMAIARQILALPNVEVASHTFSHPYDWRTGKPGLKKIKGYTDSYKVETEINGSVEYINTKLLPAGKKVKVFQWSGECNPPPGAIERADRLGLFNINGGDSRFDADYPSVAHVAPLTRPGTPVQYYASNSNENLYTGLWHGPFFGFKNVVFTWKNTESPRRLRPINAYWHFYSGEKLAALNALHHVYKWALEQDVAPVYASDYLKIAAGFFSAKLSRRADGAWLVKNNGACKTVRFDDTQAFPDLAKSGGVVGFRHYQGSLYVFLDDSQQHVIHLAKAASTVAYVTAANCFVHSLSRTGGGVELVVGAYRKSKIVLANLKKNIVYKGTLVGKGLSRKFTVTASKTGHATVSIPAGKAVHLVLKPAGSSGR